ncbi:hypothetical protein SCATT_44110 [Streptantibioticus cattleyicolor NRRL 8057 = DSM 46488]|uniref:Uncharacterized protein n=1 Tax=Streptantibioticus cattleyicolor (strain ATCC 35852 / DSM 46488 / JCM 4925 / NBRC 14057 / NRRL 8057) TaxID=1003195 RepID=G8WV19_STREN|nr:hypothetical protein SCATT_44110 [Streptantibioticus cattleyicolor NRRL 8057 = DSM 46488]
MGSAPFAGMPRARTYGGGRGVRRWPGRPVCGGSREVA